MDAQKLVADEKVDEVVKDVVARVRRLEEVIVLPAATLGEAELNGVHEREVARLYQIAAEIRRKSR
ncbi:MAG: hypothetical protein IRY99_12815 [Isosphaeraceae bacterium]|nr:hypothetical protein [Isosphaeraceae bacterium]